MAISFTAGQVLTANELNLLAPVYLVKNSSQSVTNSATLVNDNDIALTLLANQTAQITLMLDYQANTTTNVGLRLAWVAGGTLGLISRFVMGPSDAGGANPPDALTTVQMRPLTAFTTNNLYSTGTTANAAYVLREELIVTTGASGGTLTLQFAEFTAAAATTITLNNSSYAIARYVA